MFRSILAVSLAGSALVLAGCGDQTETSAVSAETVTEPVFVFPDEAEPTPFNRAYTLTESADGTVRLFTKESRDDTDIYEMRLQEDGTWSEPEVLDWPKRRSNTNPHFSPFDGRLYFASDRPIEGLEVKRDMNLWSVELTEEGWGEAVPVPGDVNTGEAETSVSTSENGYMAFVSKYPYPRGEGGQSNQGGQDIYLARFDDASGEWKMETLPDHVNSPFVESHVAITPDGNNILYYSRRSPKLGQVNIVAITRTDDEDMGGWSEPYNLGPVINAGDFAFGPGMSADGETFFFSRGGRLMELPASELNTILTNAYEASLAGEEEAFIGLTDK